MTSTKNPTLNSQTIMFTDIGEGWWECTCSH